MAKHVGDLEVAADIEFQLREWRVQRFGWTVIALIIALGLLGLFGSGPFSDATEGDPEGAIAVDYRRFVRQDAPSTLTFQIGPEQAANGTVDVWLDSDYLHGVDIESVSPQPSEVTIGDDRQTYAFAVEDVTSPMTVIFSLRPQDFGVLSAHVGLSDGPELTFRQVSYP